MNTPHLEARRGMLTGLFACLFARYDRSASDRVRLQGLAGLGALSSGGLLASSRHGYIPINRAASLHMHAEGVSHTTCPHLPPSLLTSCFHLPLHLLPTSHIRALPHTLASRTQPHQNYTHPVLTHSCFLGQKCTFWDWLGSCNQAG